MFETNPIQVLNSKKAMKNVYHWRSFRSFNSVSKSQQWTENNGFKYDISPFSGAEIKIIWFIFVILIEIKMKIIWFHIKSQSDLSFLEFKQIRTGICSEFRMFVILEVIWLCWCLCSCQYKLQSEMWWNSLEFFY